MFKSCLFKTSTFGCSFCTSNYCKLDLVLDFYFASVLILSKRLTLQCFMVMSNLHTKLQQYLCGERRVFLGGVYMTPGRLSPCSEYTPVPSQGSIFVYTRAPGLHDTSTKCYAGVSSPRFLFWGREFHSGTKSGSGVM